MWKSDTNEGKTLQNLAEILRTYRLIRPYNISLDRDMWHEGFTESKWRGISLGTLAPRHVLVSHRFTKTITNQILPNYLGIPHFPRIPI